MNKKVFSCIGWTFFAMMAITQVLQTIIAVVLGKTFPQALSQPWSIFMLIAVSFYFTTFPMYLVRMKKLPTYTSNEIKRLSIKEFIKLFIISIAATYIFNFVSIFINLILAYIKGSDIVNPLAAIKYEELEKTEKELDLGNYITEKIYLDFHKFI